MRHDVVSLAPAILQLLVFPGHVRRRRLVAEAKGPVLQSQPKLAPFGPYVLQ